MRVSAFTILASGAMLAACNGNSTAPEIDPSTFPAVVALPKGFAPEGMSFGTGSTVYVGSLLTGAIWRGDVRTGTGALLVAETAGRSATGIKHDHRSNYLFVGGGFTGQAYVYDASSGATVATYQLAAPALAETGQTLVNDVVVLQNAAYFTDSFQGVVYRVPLGTNGKLPGPGAVQTIALTGDYTFVPGGAFNGTGIAATPDGKQLILMNSEEGALYLVNPESGRATRIRTDKSLRFGDGIVLDGRTLYVVQAGPDQITTVGFDAGYTEGKAGRVITSSGFAFPTALGELGSALYVLNGRFDVAPPGMPAPDVEFQLVRVGR